jgi:hypothetical protein
MKLNNLSGGNVMTASLAKIEPRVVLKNIKVSVKINTREHVFFNERVKDILKFFQNYENLLLDGRGGRR